MKYLPAILLGIVALTFFGLAHAGDNSDARALSETLYIPAIAFTALSLIAGFVARLF